MGFGALLLLQACSTPSETPDSSKLPWARPQSWEGLPPGFGAIQDSRR